MSQSHDCFFAASEWVPATGPGRTPVMNPSTDEPMADVGNGSERDADRAVAAAEEAFPEWSALPTSQRANLIADLGEALAARGEALASTIASEVGTPIRDCQRIQIAPAARMLKRTAELATEVATEESIGSSAVYRGPLGVVGCITPWNYPLYQLACKLAPALASGSTVVLKPSEIAPLSILAFAEITRDVGLPRGVFNVVFGPGPIPGERIVTHPSVRKVTFTGSTTTGRRIASLAGSAIKPVTLELGGKSPTIVLPGAPVEDAVDATCGKLFQNAGQTCAAFTRLIVPRDELERAEELAAASAARLKTGPASDPDTTLGPVASEDQWRHVTALIRAGIDEGAKLVAGGAERPSGFPRGYFVRPTVFSNVKSEMRIAQEEIFGPVLAVMPYDTEQQALALANGTDYGLSAAVWHSDPDIASRFARRVVAGSVSINGTPTNPDAPFGGFRDSGFGRERGRYAIEEFLTTQAVHQPKGPTNAAKQGNGRS